MTEFWSNNDRGYRIRLWVDQTSQNIAGNSSQVRVRLALLNTTTTFSGHSCSASVSINGQNLSWSGSPAMTSFNQTIFLIDQTVTVGHNADGTKSFSVSASFSGSGGWSPYFNPRTREGCDRSDNSLAFLVFISIHAPAKGATL